MCWVGQRGKSVATCLFQEHFSTNSHVKLGVFPTTAIPSIAYSQVWVSVFPLSKALLCSPLSSAPSLTPTIWWVVAVFLSWPVRSDALLVWFFWLNFSLIPWLSEFYAVWFSGAFGCLFILDWLLSYFWLWEEVKGFYQCLQVGWNYDMISIFLNFLRLVLCPFMWSIFENVPCAFEKNIYFASLGWKVLYILVKFYWSRALFNTAISLLIFLFGRSIQSWQWGVEMPYYNHVAVNVFLEVLQDFLYVFGYFYVGCIFIYNVYVFLMHSSRQYYEVSFWASLYGPCFEFHFVWCEYCYPSFFFLSVCLEYLFLALHFQSV